jgi:hypothetical protein
VDAIIIAEVRTMNARLSWWFRPEETWWDRKERDEISIGGVTRRAAGMANVGSRRRRWRRKDAAAGGIGEQTNWGFVGEGVVEEEDAVGAFDVLPFVLAVLTSFDVSTNVADDADVVGNL